MTKLDLLNKISLLRQSYAMIDKEYTKITEALSANNEEQKKYIQAAKWIHGKHLVLLYIVITLISTPLTEMFVFILNSTAYWAFPLVGIVLTYFVRLYIKKRKVSPIQIQRDKSVKSNNQVILSTADSIVKYRIIANSCKIDLVDNDIIDYDFVLNNIVALDYIYGSISCDDSNSFSSAAEKFKEIMLQLQKSSLDDKQRRLLAEILAAQSKGSIRTNNIKKCEKLIQELSVESI